VRHDPFAAQPLPAPTLPFRAMNRFSSACCSVLLVLLELALCAGAHAQVVRPRHADVVLDASLQPPAATAGWQSESLPFTWGEGTAWHRIEFEAAGRLLQHPWVVYLPYFYGGGQLVLNGAPLAYVEEPSADVVVRWERPHLLPIPAALLREGRNELFIRVTATPIARGRMPLLEIGPQVLLQNAYETRLFWVRTMSQFTVAACVIVGVLGLFIWWRRREERLYGLFGAAALLWGIRTMTLVIEVMPTTGWVAWRTVYHGATGGFVIVMLLFAMQLAGIRQRGLGWGLLAYGLLGPLGYLASGGNEFLIGTVWAGGLLPIGVAVLVIGAYAAWRQRTAALAVLGLALALAVLAGFHDYLIATRSPVLLALWPQAAAHRLFLLHYGADLLLLVMGGILSARLIATLHGIERLNLTLEARVAAREAALADNFARLRSLQMQNAAGEERQKIMRDLHDGLGSQLFITLSRAEAGTLDQDQLVEALRECIADMRLTFEAMSPQVGDFLAAWANFRYRWKRALDLLGLVSTWEQDTEDSIAEIPPHTFLQLLRIVQEALTNVLKHAQASRVVIRLRADAQSIDIEFSDNGRGLGHPKAGGRGMANMRSRALRIGAEVTIADQHPGVLVAVHYRLDSPLSTDRARVNEPVGEGLAPVP
jgi:signal transduction histidine kinase